MMDLSSVILSSYTLYFLAFITSVSSFGTAINRNGWTISASSSQPGNEARYAIDGVSTTFWQSQYSPLAQLPHAVTIDMKKTYLVNGLSYLPRQDGNGNGRIGQHKIELSTDGSSWGSPVAYGTHYNDAVIKNTTFVGRPARFVRLTAQSEAQSATNQWASAAEINIYQVPDTPIARNGWSVSADSSETVAENRAPERAIDGDWRTWWITKYSGGAAPLPHWYTIDNGAETPIAGLRYLPRPNGGNGTIGNFSIETSQDNSNWVTATSGTWDDDSTEKSADFTAVSARYLRLNAFTEAGGRISASSASEINLISQRSIDGYAAPSATKGRWLYSVDFPLIPASAAVLPNGKVLMWSSYRYDTFIGGANSGMTYSAIWDPRTNIVSQRLITNTQHDMFCPGISYTSDGRVVVFGGQNSNKASFYNSATDAWTHAAEMRIPRGYQSSTALSDGKIFNIGGSWSGGEGGKSGEIFDPIANSSRLLQGCPVDPMVTVDRQGIYRADNHPWLFGWKNGSVLQAGPSKAMNWYGTAGSGSQAAAGLRGSDSDSMNGNAIMFDAVAGKILTIGGSQNYEYDNAHNRAHVLTIDSPDTTVDAQAITSATYSRAFHNSVVLPDGKTLILGGQSFPIPFTDTTPQNIPELFDPATNTFTPMNEHGSPRTYHSVALLLADATVLLGGGGLCGGEGRCGTNHLDGEVFAPPYLFNSDGTSAARPSISSLSADSVVVGGELTASTTGSVASFSLVRLGSVTHSVNTDQRRVPLTPNSLGGGRFSLRMPSNAGVLLPGYYMLFALSESGVPSVSISVRITLVS